MALKLYKPNIAYLNSKAHEFSIKSKTLKI